MDTQIDEDPDNSQSRIEIHTNLVAIQDKFFVKLQGLLDILAASLAGLDRVDESAYSNFAPIIQLSPAQNRRLSKDTAISEARHWYLRSILRDAIELTNAFVEECWLVCSLFSLSASESNSKKELDKIIGPDAKKFHSLGLPVKLQRLRDTFSVGSTFEAHVLSINRVRACLVHRIGIVSTMDTDENDELTILWRVIELLAQNPEGTEEIILDKRVEIKGGWVIAVRQRDKRKSFKRGEKVELSYSEVTDTIFSLMSFAASLIPSIEEYARRMGIHFTK